MASGHSVSGDFPLSTHPGIHSVFSSRRPLLALATSGPHSVARPAYHSRHHVWLVPPQGPLHAPPRPRPAPCTRRHCRRRAADSVSCAGWTGWPTNPPQTRRSPPTHRPAARRRPDAACLPAAPCHTAAPYPPAAPWHLAAPAVHRPLAASPPRRPRRPARPLFRAHARCPSRGSPQSPPLPPASTSFHCRRGGGGAQHWLRARGRPSGRVHSHGNTASAAEKHAPAHAHAEWGEPAAAGGSAGTAPACRPDVAQPLGAASQLPPLPRGWGSHTGAGGTRRAGGADGGPSPPPASKGGVATVFSGSPRVPLALYSVSRRIIQPLGGACMRVSWSPPTSSTQSRAWRTTGVSSLSLSRGLPAHPFLARYSGGTMDANFATISSFHQWGRGNRVPGPPDVAHPILAHWQHTRRDYFPWTWRGRKGEGGSQPPPLSPTHRAPLPPPPATRRPRGRR